MKRIEGNCKALFFTGIAGFLSVMAGICKKVRTDRPHRSRKARKARRAGSYLAVLIFSLAIIIAGVSSCASHVPVPVPVSDQVSGGSSVWLVTGDGVSMFLGGSIHILRDSDFPLPEEYDLAFSQSKALVLETDVSQMEQPEIVQYLMSRMVLSDGRTLQSLLDSDVYKMLAAKLKEYGLPIEAVMDFKPSMVINMLAVMQLQKFGFMQEGLDFYYAAKANGANMPVRFLESVQTQIDTLVSMGEGYENDFVLYSLQDMEDTEKLLDVIISDWKAGEAASTEMALNSMKETWPLIYKSLITDRHDAWMPQIKEYLHSGSTYFVIAGLAHMHGPDGLLRMLGDLGYTVKQFR